MIFDIKLDENFRGKAILVGGEHKTVVPASIHIFVSCITRLVTNRTDISGYE